MVPQPKINSKPATASTMSDSSDSMPKTADGKAFIRVPRRLLNRDDVYLKKCGTLSKMCANVEEENNKFRYHIYCVRKEIERLSMIKRGLCQRLIEHGDRDFMDTQIEYLDTSWQDEKMEHIFEDVLGNTAAPDVATTSASMPRVVKKAKVDKKKPNEHIFEDVIGSTSASDVPTTFTAPPRVIEKAYIEKKKFPEHIFEDILGSTAAPDFATTLAPAPQVVKKAQVEKKKPNEHIFEHALETPAAPDVPTTSAPASRVVKKANVEKKKPKDLPPPAETPTARETIERLLHAASSEIKLREKSEKARRREARAARKH